MVHYCCVPQCSSLFGREENVGYHSFPKNKKLRKAWIVSLRIGKPVSTTMKVCSRHFKEDDYISLEGFGYTKPKLIATSVPSQNLPRPSHHRSPNKNLDAARLKRRQKRDNRKLKREQASKQACVPNKNSVLEVTVESEVANVDPEAPSNMEISLNANLSVEIKILHEALLEHKAQIQNLQIIISEKCDMVKSLEITATSNYSVINKLLKDNESLRKCITLERQKTKKFKQMAWKQEAKLFSIEAIKHNDALLNYYTGIPNYKLFKALLEFLVPGRDVSAINYQQISPTYLDLENQLLTVLTKLRQNFGQRDLAFRFGKSKSGISRLLKTWTNYMYLRLGSLSLWPTREILIANSPSDFHQAFPNVIAVIDGTELFIEKPSDLRLQSQSYSTYKSSNTLKGLVGIDQRGGIIFISQLMDGSISDKEIVEKSGLIGVINEKLASGELLESDRIMADKGFPSATIAKEFGVPLIIPPFASSCEQMCEADVVATKNVAKFRIHVERAMARIKKFKIVSNVIPLSILGSVNQIWTIVCILANMQKPLCTK